MKKWKSGNMKKIVYCDNRKCTNKCKRWYRNAPFDELISVNRFELKKDGTCKNRLEEEDAYE